MYERVSVIEYIGKEVNQGHYYSYIKKNGSWLQYNDRDIITSLTVEVMKDAATLGYILVYQGHAYIYSIEIKIFNHF